MSSKKPVMKKDTGVINRTFHYELDGTTLRFTLRIDVKKELKAYEELLKIALKDVSDQLKESK
jgi:hypothetical protein